MIKNKELLIELGFRPKSIGIFYWVDSFKFVKENPKTWHIMDIYEAISKKRGKSISAIERAMRYSLEPAKENIRQKYQYYGRMDNMTFINLVRFEKE